MRRTAALVAAVALIGTGIAVAAPAGAAALKPGVPTAVKIAATATGTVNVTWKAPVVKKGKTAKATSYKVACTGAAVKTVKVTKASVTIIKIADIMASKSVGYQDGTTCSVTALAGKAASKAVKSNAVTAYFRVMTAAFTLSTDVEALLGKYLAAGAPAGVNASTGVISYPVTGSKQDATITQAADIFEAGTLKVGTLPAMTNISLVPDATWTSSAEVYNLVGNTHIPSLGNGGVVPVMQLTNFVDSGTQQAPHITFNVSLSTNTAVVQLVKTVLLANGDTAGANKVTPGMALGTGVMQ